MNIYPSRRMTALVFLVMIFPFLSGFQGSRVESEQGNYVISVEFQAYPVKTGMNIMRLFFRDRESGKPVKGKLKLEVVPWMPNNVHSVNEIPAVKDKGNGEYLVEKINFDTPGDWEIYVKINSGGHEDSAVFDVSVIE